MSPRSSPNGRVFLRGPDEEDRDEFIALVRKSKSTLRPWAYPPATQDGFDNYLMLCDAIDYEGMLICRTDDGAIVGGVNFSQIHYGALKSAYLGYWIGAPFAGQGYMGEALQRALRLAFRGLHLHRIEANIQPRNERSRAVAKAAGFRLEGYSPRYLRIGGRWRDHERWAITAEEWRPRKHRSTSRAA